MPWWRRRRRWPRPEFLVPPERPPAIAWIACLAGLGMLGATLVEGSGLQREIDAGTRQLARLRAAVLRPAKDATDVGAASGEAGRDPRAVRAARSIVAQLEHPWGRILADVENQTPAGVQWLLFDHGATQADLRLQGTAPTSATALELVDGLAARAGWSKVALSRLQAPERLGPGGAAEMSADAVAAGRSLSGTVEPGAASAWRFDVSADLDAGTVASTEAR